MVIHENRGRAAALPRLVPVLLAGVILLAGCEKTPPAAPASTAAPAPAATTNPGSVADRQEVTRRDDVEAKIHYPALRDELAPLDRAMHAYADAQKASLVTRMKQVEAAPERSEKPGRLDLDFTIATQTQDFVSALADGEGEFGGAHPLSLRATFTQHLATGKIVALSDLFADLDAALKAFSVEARRRLEPEFEGKLRAENLADKLLAERTKSMHDMLDAGTEPKADNFAAFLVDGVDGKAIGITLIFPATQVASYVDGPQQVAVPARVFYGQLRPEYRDAFAVDKADIEASSRPLRSTSP